MSLKVLVTGSSGFVGSHIVEDLIAAGYETYAGIRSTSSKKYLKDNRINFFEIDFDDEDDLRAKLVDQYFDYIILNAGITKARHEETYFKVNSGYTRRFCKILIEEDIIPKKLVYISSIASYGPADFQANGIVSNRSNPHPVTMYGRSKLQAEQFLETFGQIPKLIFRPTVVYGPRDYDMLEMYKTIKKGLDFRIGGVNQELSFIYVSDLSRLIVESLASPHINKSYFASDGFEYTSDDLSGYVASKLGVKPRKIGLPVSILKALAYLSEKSAKLTGKFPILNIDKVNELIPKSWKCDSEPLQKDFNFAPHFNLEKGIDKTIDWCKSQSLL